MKPWIAGHLRDRVGVGMGVGVNRAFLWELGSTVHSCIIEVWLAR